MKKISLKNTFIAGGAAVLAGAMGLEFVAGVPGPVTYIGEQIGGSDEDIRKSFPDCVNRTTGKVIVNGQSYSVSCNP